MKRLIALLYLVSIGTYVWVLLQTNHSRVPGGPPDTLATIRDYLAIAGVACFPLAVILTVVHAWRSNPSLFAIALLIPIGYGLVLIGMLQPGGQPLVAYAGGGILALALLLALRKIVARALPKRGAVEQPEAG